MLQGRSESLTVHPPTAGPWATCFTTMSLWVAGVLMERLSDLKQTKAWCWGAPLWLPWDCADLCLARGMQQSGHAKACLDAGKWRRKQKAWVTWRNAPGQTRGRGFDPLCC